MAKTVALKASYRFWNLVFGFIVQVPYPGFRKSSDFIKWRRTVEELRKTFPLDVYIYIV